MRLNTLHDAILVQFHVESVRSAIVVDGSVCEIPGIFILRPQVGAVNGSAGHEEGAEGLECGPILSLTLQVGRI